MSKDICANRHKGNPKSVAAHRKIRADKRSIRQKILDQIGLTPDITCEALEFMLLLKHQTCSARISELKRDGLIYISGEEETLSGCKAATYKVTDPEIPC